MTIKARLIANYLKTRPPEPTQLPDANVSLSEYPPRIRAQYPDLLPQRYLHLFSVDDVLLYFHLETKSHLTRGVQSFAHDCMHNLLWPSGGWIPLFESWFISRFLSNAAIRVDSHVTVTFSLLDVWARTSVNLLWDSGCF